MQIFVKWFIILIDFSYRRVFMEEIEGLRYLLSLSYAAIDKSDVAAPIKRNLIFSVYSFGLIFDRSDMTKPDPLLIKDRACYLIKPNEHPQYEEDKEYFDTLPQETTFVKGGGVYDGKLIKFDAGGYLWRKCVDKGILSGEDAIEPIKYPLYELVYRLLTLSSVTAELKAMWYIFFPYAVNMGAPYDDETYNKLKAIVLTEDNFKQVLESKYSDKIYINTKEMVLGGVDPVIIDWFIEYTEWKNVKNEKGISRETEKYQKQLVLGNFDYVIKGTEKMLDVYPDDEEIYLLNMTAKVSYAGTLDGPEREKIFDDIIVSAQDALSSPIRKKKNYVAYYLGLAFLGKKDIDKAESSFKLALTYDPKFELADMMLKGMKKLENK